MPYCTDQHRTTEKGIRFKLRGRGPVHQAIIGYIVDRVKVIRKSRTSHIGIGRGQRYGERNQQRSEQKDAAQTSQMMFYLSFFLSCILLSMVTEQLVPGTPFLPR